MIPVTLTLLLSSRLKLTMLVSLLLVGIPRAFDFMLSLTAFSI